MAPALSERKAAISIPVSKGHAQEAEPRTDLLSGVQPGHERSAWGAGKRKSLAASCSGHGPQERTRTRTLCKRAVELAGPGDPRSLLAMPLAVVARQARRQRPLLPPRLPGLCNTTRALSPRAVMGTEASSHVEKQQPSRRLSLTQQNLPKSVVCSRTKAAALQRGGRSKGWCPREASGRAR
ncbi:uncharacterized protein [Struthio camelus]|uniref:uncharacterized protein n=1 Tax=Struthio camelus TaxID=8801 RepID=UPI003603F97B